ncbi:MAG: bifunctional 2-keto-4-hydroxyglutarate aldolase/2-keto-3-deoxy-6-phosphogluconate aldolase [Acidobacteria bacterium]|nr:bifunctional 2-keto-4-hydroxyglutarate aldolase/2-keto-3-deoxy-6-phosphogluconate aldolase [Acidobacteriota bacterium]MCW5948355.1 bifunctional 2-keto-4-hydroxyglutarate aldolase/2-keto-3-deoxy-6-phosphogluconate aldolase [Pyrinomonadaceae bacterium]
MNKAEIVKQIEDLGLVPVVRASSADEAMQGIEAIKAGGVNVLEITMTVPGAVRVIEQVADRYGSEVLVGAGTVLDPETARACLLAGAQFIVSPALNIATIELCHRYSAPVAPGVLTPTEVITAWSAGVDFVKVFPCGSVGGASYVKNLKGPFPQVKIIPTGGVSLATAADFIKAGAAALGVGTDLVDVKAIREGNAQIVTERARQFVEIVKTARG